MEVAEAGMTGETQDIVIATYEAGTADADELNSLISSAWADALFGPDDRRKIAAILGVQPECLSAELPPMRADIRRSGITGAEIAIAGAAAFLVAFAKELGSASGKATAESLERLWKRVLERRVRSSSAEALGRDHKRGES